MLRISPVKTNLISSNGLSKCSSIVRKSASVWVGWSTSVKPFHTGTPEYFASASTVSCLNPLNSIPSYILPNTFAVSSIDSFFPICELLKNVACPPSSKAATSKEHRVLVDVFSKIKHTFFPNKCCPIFPAFLSTFNWCAKSNKYLISSLE